MMNNEGSLRSDLYRCVHSRYVGYIRRGGPACPPENVALSCGRTHGCAPTSLIKPLHLSEAFGSLPLPPAVILSEVEESPNVGQKRLAMRKAPFVKELSRRSAA